MWSRWPIIEKWKLKYEFPRTKKCEFVSTAEIPLFLLINIKRKKKKKFNFFPLRKSLITRLKRCVPTIYSFFFKKPYNHRRLSSITPAFEITPRAHLFFKITIFITSKVNEGGNKEERRGHGKDSLNTASRRVGDAPRPIIISHSTFQYRRRRRWRKSVDDECWVRARRARKHFCG